MFKQNNTNIIDIERRRNLNHNMTSELTDQTFGKTYNQFYSEITKPEI